MSTATAPVEVASFVPLARMGEGDLALPGGGDRVTNDACPSAVKLIDLDGRRVHSSKGARI